MKKIKIALSIMVAALTILVVTGCTATKTVTNPDGSQSVVHELDPRTKATLDTIGTIGGVVPPPYGWIIGLGASLVAAVGTGAANYKNKREANANKTKAAQLEDVMTTIIQGVEAAGEAAANVKKHIEARSITDGNKLLVDAAVQKELS